MTGRAPPIRAHEPCALRTRSRQTGEGQRTPDLRLAHEFVLRAAGGERARGSPGQTGADRCAELVLLAPPLCGSQREVVHGIDASFTPGTNDARPSPSPHARVSVVGGGRMRRREGACGEGSVSTGTHCPALCSFRGGATTHSGDARRLFQARSATESGRNAPQRRSSSGEVLPELAQT